jgi:PAS domain S-box-containing protein
VIDATPDWIYVKDREYRFTLVNQSFARAFGQTPDTMVGRKDTDFLPLELIALHVSEGMRNFRGDDDSVLRGETIHDPCDRVFFKSGDDRVFDTFKYPLHDASQSIFGVLGYRRDITERINREEKQKALETQLWQAQKMELVGHLTGGIAHDFNNILASILGYAELLQMSPDIRQNANLGKYLQEILQSGIRAKDLVAQLLTFSHKRVAATEAISVAPIVKEVMQMLRSTIPASISITAVIEDALPEVLISPVQLHQIVTNLVVNARDAIDGTGSIDLRVESLHADQALVCDACHLEFGGRLVLISIRDSGSGIPEANLLRIFDPFFTTKGVGRGSGLGLSVLHGIVHSANGHLSVRTKPGDGTEFRIFLPAQVPDARSSDPAGESARESSRVGGHVMVVDDEAVIVEYMKVLFKELGCRVTGLTSASAALRLFESNPQDIDMVFTDQSMPEITGAELCRAMLARRPDLPIVMNTGYSSEIDAGIAQKIGIRRFLIKPVPAKVLEDLVAEYLPRHSRDLPKRNGLAE